MNGLDRLVYGVETPPALPIREAAGQLTLEIEPETGAVRHVAWRGVEVVRMIYANVRKDDWSTIVPKIANLAVTHAGDGFRATYDARCLDGAYDFAWKGIIEADGKGHLTFTMDGEARGGFLTRRTGVCLLHPAQLKGTRVEVTHAVGGEGGDACEVGAFPTTVMPGTPFTDVAGIVCEPYPGATATIAFEGDLFEMEDQRNFGDDSFKTYVYPQHRPQPYRIEAGQRVRHVVRLTVAGDLPKTTPAMAPETPPKTPALATTFDGGTLGGLPFARLLADPAHLEAAKGAGLPVTLVSADPADAARAGEGGFALLGGDPAALSVRPRYAGTAGVFADLNRNRPKAGSFEGLLWAATPQIHLFDTKTLFENTHTYRDQVTTARSFGGDAQIVLGPVRMLASGEDPRWNSLVGLGWTVAVLAGAAKAGADVLALESLSRFDGKLPRLALEDFAGWEVAGFEGSRDFLLTALHLRQGGRRRALVANGTPEEVLLKLPTSPGTAKARVLDAANIAAVAADLALWGRMEGGALPLRLRPHAYVAVDFEG